MGLPGDPNGAFCHNGRYHLMYLYHRNGSGFCWGHISSLDLVHWRHHPDAIGPDNGDEGCFSGGAFVDEDGTAYLSYWDLGRGRGICLASSRDPHFDTWTKLESNPVIRSTEFGITEVKADDGKSHFYGSAGPSNIWKKDGRYYLLTGNLLVLRKIGIAPGAPLSKQGDRLYLFGRFRLLSGFRGEVEAAAVEVDCVDEVLLVLKSPGGVLHPLDLGADRFAAGVGDAVS